MVISDHGMGSFENRPPFKGWHVSPGIFVGSGPGFAQSKGKVDVSYYDIVSTILDLQGLAKPANLRDNRLQVLDEPASDDKMINIDGPSFSETCVLQISSKVTIFRAANCALVIARSH